MNAFYNKISNNKKIIKNKRHRKKKRQQNSNFTIDWHWTSSLSCLIREKVMFDIQKWQEINVHNFFSSLSLKLHEQLQIKIQKSSEPLYNNNIILQQTPGWSTYIFFSIYFLLWNLLKNKQRRKTDRFCRTNRVCGICFVWRRSNHVWEIPTNLAG